MSQNVDGRAVTVSVKIYERLLATYPADFRREYGPAMKQLFRDQCRDAWSEARGWGLAVVWLRMLPDLAKTSFVEHLSNLNQRESMFMKLLRAFGADPRLRAASIRVFAAVFIGTIVCSALVAVWSPRIYSSTVRIEVQQDPSKITAAHPKAGDGVDRPDPYFLTTQFKIIESYFVLTNVIADLRLNEKLARQHGLPEWTIDETYAYLGKVMNVKQTRMTSLFEVTIKNPDPQLAAAIANRIAWSYRNNRLDQWKLTHFGGIKAYQNNLIAIAQELKEKQEALDTMREKLGVSEPDRQDEAFRPYYRLKDEVENLRYNYRQSERYLNQEIAKAGHPDAGIVIVRDPARVEPKPVARRPWIFLMWMLGGTLLALVSGGAAAWVAVSSSRLSGRLGAPS